MIYLIRHGEPAAGWGAHPDPGLSDLGRKQAEAAARTLVDLGARRAVTSPLARCRQTCQPFERLVETHGRIETRVGEVITPPDVEDRPAWLKQVMQGGWSEVEGFDAWRAGMLEAVRQCPDETAIFSHFVAINVLVGLLTGDDRVLIFRPGHASITRLENRGGVLRVVELGSEGALQAL